MKKVIDALMLPLIVVIGLLFANCETKNETAKRPTQNPLTAAEMKAQKKKWEASPDGIEFNKWKESPQGRKVLTCAAKIKKDTTIEAVVTSLSLPPGSRLGFGVMARIDGDDYIVTFETQKSQLESLQSLKVNDKISIKSHGVSYAPKYSYPIVSCAYLESDGKVIFKRVPRKDGC